jgi:hypothetical protein
VPVLNYFPTAPRAQAAFQFDHAQAHITLTRGTPVQRRSNLANFLLDPMINGIGPTVWGMNHQTAHDREARVFVVQPSQILADETTGSPWWTWVNSKEHEALSAALLAATPA